MPKTGDIEGLQCIKKLVLANPTYSSRNRVDNWAGRIGLWGKNRGAVLRQYHDVPIDMSVLYDLFPYSFELFKFAKDRSNQFAANVKGITAATVNGIVEGSVIGIWFYMEFGWVCCLMKYRDGDWVFYTTNGTIIRLEYKALPFKNRNGESEPSYYIKPDNKGMWAEFYKTNPDTRTNYTLIHQLDRLMGTVNFFWIKTEVLKTAPKESGGVILRESWLRSNSDFHCNRLDDLRDWLTLCFGRADYV